MKYTCKCAANCAFHWRDDKSPTIFANDPHFRTSGGFTNSQWSTMKVEKQRAEGKPAGTIKGISRSREDEVLRMRRFSTYSLAGVAGFFLKEKK
jgi:hypothetical protein